jgi:hypothetical protein
MRLTYDRRNDIVVRTKLQDIEDTLRGLAQSISPHTPKQPFVTNSHIQSFTKQQTSRSSRQRERAVHNQTSVQSSHAHRPVTRRHHDPPYNSKNIASIRAPQVLVNPDHPRLKVYEQADRTLLFETGNCELHEITKSAAFLQDSLATCFEDLHTHAGLGIDKAPLEHIQKLFDLLIASAHTSSAEHIMKKYGGITSPAKMSSETPVNTTVSTTSINKSPVATCLEDKTFSLATNVDCIKIKILIARSFGDSRTVAFTFQYTGSESLNLPPLTIDFMSHELGNYYPLQRPFVPKGQKVLTEDNVGHIIGVHKEFLFSAQVS